MSFGGKFLYGKKNTRRELLKSLSEHMKSKEEIEIEAKEGIEEVSSEILERSMDKKELLVDC